LNHFSFIWMMLSISMNLGSFGNVRRSNMETHHFSLSFLFSSVNSGFSVLEWRRSSPSLNHLCRVLFFTPMACARDRIVLLLCKGTLRISDRSTCIFLRPHFLGILDLTSTGLPCARHYFALCQMRCTRYLLTWNN
jgi:hypothetical protein